METTVQTYAMLSRITPGSVNSSDHFKETAAKVRKMIETEVPEAKWISSYSLLGHYDVLDIFEAPGPQHVATISAIVRFHAHAETETMVAEEWGAFVSKAGKAKH
jgi:uncharacterized protein with GYD domain